MPIFLISCSELLRRSTVPDQLGGYITQNQWEMMCAEVADCYSQGQLYACAGECVLCWCLTPLIFLCHPCFAGAFTTGALGNRMNHLNLQLFHGQHVLSCTDGFNIAVNSEFIPNNNMEPIPAQVQVIERVVYDGEHDRIQTVEVITTTTANPSADHHHHHNHHQHVKQNFNMTIPDGVTPGMTIPVETPDGKQITVTIPNGTHPGQKIIVQY